MEAWTRRIIRHRKKVIAAWLVLLVLGGYGAANVGKLLSNRFSVPGSDAERGLDLLKNRFDERGDGAFTMVFQADRPVAGTAVFKRRAEAATRQAASAVGGARPGPVLPASRTVAYAQIYTPLENADAADKTTAVRDATPQIPGATTYLSGFPAINHDTQKIYNQDLARGESIAIPIALIVLAFMFGTLVAIGVPFAFAFVTIPSTLGAIWIVAHFTDMAVYVTNIVTLIGFAIAVDYSMLVVFRFREELERTESTEEALVTTMKTAGRATLFSGGTVAIGLALLIFMPLPFMRSMGIGGLLVPLFSIAASATFLPALLSLLGRKINRFRVIPKRILAARAEGRPGFWTRLSRSIMRRPVLYLIGAGGLMLALAVPALQLHLTGGDNRGVPLTTESTKGLALLDDTLGPGALAPNQVAIDTGQPGRATQPATVAAERRLVVALRGDPEIDPSTIQAPILAGPGPAGLARAQKANLIDSQRQVIQIRAAGKSDSGTPEAVDLVHRIRDDYIPAAGFPTSTTVLLTGAPAFGVDFIDRAYSAFPWLVLAVLVLSYLLLLRAFRSVILPIKAVLMNLLSVAATYGVLVLVFQHGFHSVLGLQPSAQIEAWIPVFLFAMLFGLSMDYEVFLLSRMREEWDAHHDNERAVAGGLEHTGRIITAAAIIMIAAFSGFTAGSFVGLQEFGIGLSAAILLDATVVRAMLVPALMKLLGDWNWYLPERVRRALRLSPGRPATESGSPPE
ncbi:MAG: MMPL family transporter [Solirubrobacterales bacterium]